jgi:SAM-dependent methyltransferase
VFRVPGLRDLARSLDDLASIPAALRSRVLAALPPALGGRFRSTLAWIFANGGGRNGAGRFAGNLVRTDLLPAEVQRIYHALILPNGVRKTSHRARNTGQLCELLVSGEIALPQRVRVLDMGASLGVDALATAELLRAQKYDVAEYVLGDLHPSVLYDGERGLVFDEDGTLLQVRRRRSFVSIHFSYAHAFHRITHLPKRLLPWMLRRRHRYDPAAPLVSIPLVDPRLRVDDASSPFRLRRLDVFRPFVGEFDFILCMNLLLPQYFDPDAIERATSNLATHLAPGGTVVVGGAGRLRVLHHGDGGAESRWRCSSRGHCAGCPRAGEPTQSAAHAEGARRCAWTARRPSRAEASP